LRLGEKREKTMEEKQVISMINSMRLVAYAIIATALMALPFVCSISNDITSMKHDIGRLTAKVYKLQSPSVSLGSLENTMEKIHGEIGSLTSFVGGPYHVSGIKGSMKNISQSMGPLSSDLKSINLSLKNISSILQIIRKDHKKKNPTHLYNVDPASNRNWE
jgi:hypothetical protein